MFLSKDFGVALVKPSTDRFTELTGGTFSEWMVLHSKLKCLERIEKKPARIRSDEVLGKSSVPRSLSDTYIPILIWERTSRIKKKREAQSELTFGTSQGAL